MQLKITLPCIILIIAGLSFQFHSQAQGVNRKVTEKLLSKVETSSMINNSFTVSNNKKRIGYRIRAGNKQMVVIDDIKGIAYDSVSAPVFSWDGRRTAYAAKNGSNWLLLVDDKPEASFSADSTIRAVMFSPDSKSIAYVVKERNKYFVVFNKVNGKPYDGIDENSISFSADSRMIAYSVRMDKMQFNVIDGREGSSFNQVGFPLKSLTGKHIAYWGKDSAHSYVIYDNVKSQPYDAVTSIIFSSDDKHCTYIATRNGKQFVVTDGVESEKSDIVHSICYSPDGKRLAYGIDLASGVEGLSQYALVDGKRGDPYITVVEGSLLFSADSRRFVYKAEMDDNFMMVLDGKAGKWYNEVIQITAVFSPDNLRFAYAAEKDSKRMVIADGIEYEPYNEILSIVFSPDSKRVVYSVKQDNSEMVVVEGNKGRVYDYILGEGGIVFESPDMFHYLAKKGNSIYLVEEKIE